MIRTILIVFEMFKISSNLFSRNIIRKYSDNCLELWQIILRHYSKMVYPSVIRVRIIFIIHPFIHINYVHLFNLLESYSQLFNHSDLLLL